MSTADFTLYPSGSRGITRLSRLESRHSFSFGSWYHPDFMGFGMLRVLNEDFLAPGAGFDAHPHDNMEIITIPLEGRLEHRDSMGNHGIIEAGDIQIISAGTGIFHSEYNPDPKRPVHFLQIWILPQRRNFPPAYRTFHYEPHHDKEDFVRIISLNPEDQLPSIRQQAGMWIGRFKRGKQVFFQEAKSSFGIFLFLVKGKISIFDQELDKGDAIGIRAAEKPSFLALEDCIILLLQIPMNQTPS